MSLTLECFLFVLLIDILEQLHELLFSHPFFFFFFTNNVTFVCTFLTHIWHWFVYRKKYVIKKCVVKTVLSWMCAVVLLWPLYKCWSSKSGGTHLYNNVDVKTGIVGNGTLLKAGHLQFIYIYIFFFYMLKIQAR